MKNKIYNKKNNEKWQKNKHKLLRILSTVVNQKKREKQVKNIQIEKVVRIIKKPTKDKVVD